MTLANRVALERAFVLHTRAFKETSLIVEVFTESFGRLSLVAKGARRPKSQLRPIQTPTSELSISYSGRGDLKNLTQCEIIQHYNISSKVAFSCIVYLNELLIKTLEKEDPHSEVFNQFSLLCNNLSKENDQQKIEVQLRSFELILLQELGYGIDLESESITGEKILAESYYSFDPSLGFSKISRDVSKLSSGFFLGNDIIEFSKGNLNEAGSRKAAKKIMRRALDFNLGNKTLNIRKYLIEKEGSK